MNEQALEVNQPKKMGRLKKSWLITKSAWRVFKLDKEIVVIPLIVGFLEMIFAIAVLIVGFVLFATTHNGNSVTYNGWGFALIVGAMLALIATFTNAAVIAMALDRLRGHDPTIQSGLRAVKKRFGSLFLYGLLNAGVTQVLGYLDQRIPFVGRIIVWLTDIAWSLASIFAVAVIVDSDKHIGPIKALRGSMGLFRKSWGESLASKISVGLIFFLIVLFEAMAGTGVGFSFLAAGHPIVFGFAMTGMFLAMMATVLLGSIIQGIVSAALYHYATTAFAPA